MAKLKAKLYLCTDGADNQSLVRALTKASAMSYVAAKSITVEVAGPDDIVRLTKAGVEVEAAQEPAAVLTGTLPLDENENAPAATAGDATGTAPSPEPAAAASSKSSSKRKR